MKKRTMIIIAVFVVLVLIFIGWSKIYSPINKTGRCRTTTDCAVREPQAGFYYVCESGKCIGMPLVDETKQCSVNDDCVPATCCHASEAVNKENAPDCTDTFCTEECRSDTLDCQQGEIKCVDGFCEAVMFES